MTYEISHSGGIIKLEDKTLNNTDTNLRLVGKGTSPYGEYLQQNLVDLLQNFAGLNPPSRGTPIVGQLWFDTRSGTLNVYKQNGESKDWVSIGSGGSGDGVWALTGNGYQCIGNAIVGGSDDANNDKNLIVYGRLEINQPTGGASSKINGDLIIENGLLSSGDESNNGLKNDSQNLESFVTKSFIQNYTLNGTPSTSTLGNIPTLSLPDTIQNIKGTNYLGIETQHIKYGVSTEATLLNSIIDIAGKYTNKPYSKYIIDISATATLNYVIKLPQPTQGTKITVVLYNTINGNEVPVITNVGDETDTSKDSTKTLWYFDTNATTGLKTGLITNEVPKMVAKDQVLQIDFEGYKTGTLVFWLATAKKFGNANSTS